MTLLDSWMPTCDGAARYSISIAASPARVYAALLATDFSRLWLVRALMGARLIPAFLRAPGPTWRRLRRASSPSRPSLADLAHSDFVLLEAAPPREIVLGITGRFWKPAAEIVPVSPARFRAPLAAGLAQAVWNFAVREAPGGTTLTTETRVRCADAPTRRRFQLYWWLVAPGSGLIRHAILSQVRRNALAAAG